MSAKKFAEKQASSGKDAADRKAKIEWQELTLEENKILQNPQH